MTQRLTNLKITRVAAVDSPANKSARVMLWKREGGAPVIDDGDYPSSILKRTFTADERKADAKSGAAMPDGSYPVHNAEDLSNAIRAVGRGNGSHAAIRAHIKGRAKALGLENKIPDDWNVAKSVEVAEAVSALSEAIAEISQGTDIAKHDSAVAESVQQFEAFVKGLVPEGLDAPVVKAALTAAGFTVTPAGAVEKAGEGEMTIDIKKSLGLPETATDAQVTEALATLAKSASRMDAVLKMSAPHTAFMNSDDSKMPKGGKAAWMDMTSAERDAHMADNPIEKRQDETFTTVKGTVVSKRAVGDATFQVLKESDAEVRKAREDVAKAEDARAKEVVIKRITPVMKNIPGTPDDLGALLHGIAKSDAATATKVEALLTQLDTVIGKSALLAEIGSSVAKAGSASEGIQKAAEEIRKAKPALTIEQARVEARKSNRDLADREATERREDARKRAA